MAAPAEKGGIGTSSVVNSRYHITRRIGGGSFGEIYLGIAPNAEKVKCLPFYPFSTLLM